MSNLLNMKIRIASELKRADLLGEITDAINDSISICQKYRFRFSTGAPFSPTFLTAIGTTYYDIPAPGMYQIDYLECFDSLSVLTKVARRQPEVVRMRMLQSSGRPTVFGIETESIILAPTPDAVYTIIPHGHIKVAAPATDMEANNRWMVDGERLIRLLAKREIYRDVVPDKGMFDVMNSAFIAEGMQLITEQDRLNFYQGMQMLTEDVKGQQKIIAPGAA